jgi:hypothetical protein
LIREQDVTSSFSDVTSTIRGLEVSHPSKGAGSAIFLELGQVAPPAGRQRNGRGEACISVGWDWGVEACESVLYGSSNRGPEIAKYIDDLRHTKIIDLVVEGAVPELIIRFDNGQVLRTMAMLRGDPQWWIRLQSGGFLYARRGSTWRGNDAYEMSDAERASFDAAACAASRWGRPSTGPAVGQCSDCRWFIPLDGDGHLLDNGACIASDGPLDGQIVNVRSG